MRKYIREREDKIYLPDRREKEQPEKRIFMVLRLIRQGKKNMFRVFIFFKGKSIKFFF